MGETITRQNYEEGFTHVSEAAAMAVAANGGNVRVTDKNGRYRFLVRWPICTVVNRPTPDQHHKKVILPDGKRLVYSKDGWHPKWGSIEGSEEYSMVTWYGRLLDKKGNLRTVISHSESTLDLEEPGMVIEVSAMCDDERMLNKPPLRG